MADHEGTRRWRRLERANTESDALHLLRMSIIEIREAPGDGEARRRLRAIAAEHGLWEQLALLLSDEARAHVDRPAVAAVFFAELADVHDTLDQAPETIAALEALVELAPDVVAHHDRIAWLYRRAGAWTKAADAFEQVGLRAPDDRARGALLAAAQLNRDHGRLDRAAMLYRLIVARHASDLDAWEALDDVLVELGRWREVAEVRGERAAQADHGVEKAALLRSQARALEHAGDLPGAAQVVAAASDHAPGDVSGLVDHAEVLARAGQGPEAAAILRTRVADALERGASLDDVAALRLRLARVLEDSCGDRSGADAVLDELLAAAPEHLPALERITALAASDPDPRAHAAALLRYAAALPDGADRAAYVAVAGRRLREAGDLGGAARAFAQAAELATDDVQLQRELDEVRASTIVEQAAAAARAGDLGGAERRLREILASHRHHVEANLALADLLATTDRGDVAAAYLRDTLAMAPDDLAAAALARLVHRCAVMTAQQGDVDESHQLLHEAHRLDRGSLPIALALGEACFARRLWRQAALHLGALAEHPDAARHAAEIAAGLVHAAQAEVRALRPANAGKHYDAAVRLDPGCASAWHGLAQAAIERGDLVRAADCFEREATATVHGKDRLRLFTALGDLALDVLADPARAERCWSQVAELGHAPLLDKLLALQRARGATLERAETCERLVALQPDAHGRRELLVEAAQALLAGGAIVRASAIAEQLIGLHPRDPDTVGCASTIAIAAGDPKRAAMWLRRALSAWDASGDRGEPDPRRAELWRRLGDAERALGDEPAALQADQRADTALIALVETGQEPLDALAWARSLMRSDELERARAGFELAAAVGATLSVEDEHFLDTHPARIMASDEAYAAPLDDDDRRELVDDPADRPLRDVLELLVDIMALVCPSASAALLHAGLQDATRVPTASDAATAALYPQIARALGGPPTLLYTTAAAATDLTLLLAAPPVVVIGPRLASVRAGSRGGAHLASDAALRFQLGRIVELSRPPRLFAAALDAGGFALLVAGLRHGFGPPSGLAAAPDEVAEAERLRARLPVAVRQRMTERLATIAPDALDANGYIAACQRAADRAGLLVCGDVAVAIELAGGPAVAPHLVRLASTQRYLAARKKLRARGR